MGSIDGRITVTGLAEAARQVRETFRRRVRERFGPSGHEEELDFHSPGHSEEVAASARKFLEIVRAIDPASVSELDLELVEIEGLAHDSVQKATITPGRSRLRHRGYLDTDIPPAARRRGVEVGNERASAVELLEELAKYSHRDGTPVFPIGDPAFREEVADDIGATYPDVDADAEIDGMRGTKIFQPHLTARSSLRGLALATADLRGDLGSASDPRPAMRQGDAEFRELRTAIKQELNRGVERIPRRRRVRIAHDILHWMKDQVVFAKWQKALFLDSLEENASLGRSAKAAEIKRALREHHRFFDQNIEAIRRRAEEISARYGDLADPPRLGGANAQAARERFRALLREIGYVI